MSTTATDAAASSRAPLTDPGQPTADPGSAAACRATWATHQTGTPAAVARSRAMPSSSGLAAVARTPSTVAGATAGATSRLAGTATRLSRPLNSTITGPHTSCAASGTASASARDRGTPLACHLRAQTGASRTSPPVASTDSTKP